MCEEFAKTVQDAANSPPCLQPNHKNEATLELHSNRSQGRNQNVAEGLVMSLKLVPAVTSTISRTWCLCKHHKQEYCELMEILLLEKYWFVCFLENETISNILSCASLTNGCNPAEGTSGGTCQSGTANLWPSVTKRRLMAGTFLFSFQLQR